MNYYDFCREVAYLIADNTEKYEINSVKKQLRGFFSISKNNWKESLYLFKNRFSVHSEIDKIIRNYGEELAFNIVSGGCLEFLNNKMYSQYINDGHISYS